MAVVRCQLGDLRQVTVESSSGAQGLTGSDIGQGTDSVYGTNIVSQWPRKYVFAGTALYREGCKLH